MTRAAIVTCGGLCPGLNSVIKGLVETLHQEYGVTEVYGIPYGYRGLNAEYGHRPVVLGPDQVDTIHHEGGSILGSSRGAQDADKMVQTLVNLRANLLFTVGGDGTLKGAMKIVEAIKRIETPATTALRSLVSISLDLISLAKLKTAGIPLLS